MELVHRPCRVVLSRVRCRVRCRELWCVVLSPFAVFSCVLICAIVPSQGRVTPTLVISKINGARIPAAGSRFARCPGVASHICAHRHRARTGWSPARAPRPGALGRAGFERSPSLSSQTSHVIYVRPHARQHTIGTPKDRTAPG